MHSDTNAFTATNYRSNVLTGPLAQDYDAGDTTRAPLQVPSASVSLARTYKGDDHNLTLRAGYSAYDYGLDDQSLYDFQLPVRPDLFQDVFSRVSHRQLDLKAEYKAPLSATSRLDLGYDGQISRDGSDNLDQLGTSPATAIVETALDHGFGFDQSVHALFATYQQRLGRFTVMPGLRLEDVSLDIADTGSPAIRRGYVELYPDPAPGSTRYADRHRPDGQLHSRRVQRPSGAQLDPFRVYASPFAFSQGNPLLAPEITDSFEAEAAWTKGTTYFSADLFYRDHKNLVSSVTENLGAGALLTTYVNEGHSRTAGVELAGNAPLTPHITFNLSADVLWRDIAVPVTAFEHPSSGGEATLRPKLNWDITPKDFLQLTVYARTRMLTPQGYLPGGGALVYAAGGFRHKFNDRLSLDVTVVDPFDMLKLRNVIETPDLTEIDHLDLRQRAVAVSFTVALGPHPRPAPRDFDFNAAATPGAPAAAGAPSLGGAPAN